MKNSYQETEEIIPHELKSLYKEISDLFEKKVYDGANNLMTGEENDQ